MYNISYVQLGRERRNQGEKIETVENDKNITMICILGAFLVP